MPPVQFDEYRIISPLGRGGMGEVYLAADTILDRPVAVKFLSALEPDAAARERFLTEARAAARLQHPNVVIVHRVGEHEGRPFIVSELVRGESLDRIEHPVAWRRVLEIGLDLGRGLAAAHRRGVLHRDVKPANAILAEDGRVKLLDFGVAKLLERSSAPAVTPSVAPPRPPSHHGRDRETPITIPVGPARGRSSRVPRDPPLTSSGAIVGTPLYMAPEVWRGEPATRRSDLYSLGVLLYEIASGTTPFVASSREALAAAVQAGAPRPLAAAAPEVEPGLGAIVDRCLRLDPGARWASADELVDALEQLTPLARSGPVPPGNPYRGLRSFEVEHRPLFFGRSGEARMIVDRLRSGPFVLVAGDSGVGKSSLCRAGVLPVLMAPPDLEGRSWKPVILVPGHRPLAAFSSALAAAMGVEEARFSAALREPELLARTLGACLGSEAGIAVLIDQLEELVTSSAPDEAAAVAEALGRLAMGVPGVRLLATVRSDFLARVASLPGLGYEVVGALYFLRPLGPDRIREVIEGPARATGIRFEREDMIDELVRASAQAEGGLPLLQFTLAELWEARDPESRAIPASALSKLGGLAGALARHADGIVTRLPAEHRQAARTVLTSLVTLERTRARRDRAELHAMHPGAAPAIDALVEGRILVARESDGRATIELAHEALIDGWGTLGAWLAEERETRALRRRLEQAVAEWQRLGLPEALWRDRRLAEAASLPRGTLRPEEASFLALSRRALWRRRAFFAAAVLAVPIAAFALWALARSSERADVARRVAGRIRTARSLGLSAALLASRAGRLRAEAFGRFDASDATGGERLWADATHLEARADDRWARAGGELEAAILLDARAPRTRSLLADVLVGRIVLSERARRDPPTELVRRLALFDAGGRRRARLAAPATLEVRSNVAARVELARFEDDGAGRLSPGWVQVSRGLEPGSYLVVLKAHGRADVRAPILLGRGRRELLNVRLPVRVPESMVFVPPGRFLTGSRADDELRRGFLHAAPLHEVATGAYLVARNETTFAEWIEYLDALPEEERARRTPSVGAGGFGGGVRVQRAVVGWRLTIQPSGHAFTVVSGELVRYPSRDGPGQDWLKMPVVGIDFEDARAYSAWLDRSGRLPGARLCDELEWERAARGADGRTFPHGERLDPGDANHDRTYGRDTLALGPDEVGSHPASRSPFGLDDMTGNVWEWTTSHGSPGLPVARGGAFGFDAKTCESANREIVDPAFRDVSLGMRLCADAGDGR
ncbi:MAG: SUMF1/EgtB/PvdO family nonheme iron enzyme [Deltaproteobacteria bacterium]|nr:SUMF1/EgtB/PvdO family nonheme iron enzyme [Deltaproteobacteria bacterium]